MSELISGIRGELLIKPHGYKIGKDREQILVVGLAHMHKDHKLPEQGVLLKFGETWGTVTFDGRRDVDERMAGWRLQDLFTHIKWELPK